jgi:hypothetical protein
MLELIEPGAKFPFVTLMPDCVWQKGIVPTDRQRYRFPKTHAMKGMRKAKHQAFEPLVY